MSDPFQQIVDIINDLTYQVADLKRRQANFIRAGVVKSFDPKTNTAVLDVGFETHDVPVFNQAGTGKCWRPLKEGQQITMLCPDGDAANAVCLPGGFHDRNRQPSQSADEDIVAQRGEGDKAVRLRTTDGAAFIEALASAIVVKDGEITLKADKIVLDGVTHIGGADADKPAGMKDTIDTHGDALISALATRVFLK